MNRKKVLVGTLLVVVIGGIIYANFAFKRRTGIDVTVEPVQRRDLEAVVSASGTIQPKESVDISADTMGRVVNLAVNEGDIVKKGQFLLQIDPKNLETAVQNQEASLAAAKSSLEEMRKSVDSAKVSLTQSEATANRQKDLHARGLLADQDFEISQNDLKVKEAALQQSEQSLKTQQMRIDQQQAMLDSAKYDLTKVRIVSPIDGIVTKRNILEGETVVIGTMNNAGTVLLTVADMSVIQAEVEVDETDIPSVRIGQPATVTIDALPDQTFHGTVTEVGNSPDTTSTNASSSSSRATNFLVKVTIDGTIPQVRPGFTCTANITTATRKQAISVPIQATTVRELVVDQAGHIVPSPAPEPGQPHAALPVANQELKPGQSRKEIEGVFVVKNDSATFVPTKTGIAGDKYFEVLDGVQPGDKVITGPFSSVRTLKDGDPVKISTTTTPVTTAQ